MKTSLLRFVAATLAAITLNSAQAAIQGWEPNGTTTVGGSGTWDTTTPLWTPEGTQTQVDPASLVPWNINGTNAALFCAGPGGSTNLGTFAITVNSAIPMGGIYNGQLNPGPCTVTFSGPGSFDISTAIGQLATFATFNGSLGFTHVNIPITGASGIQVQSTGQIFFDATNTYSGGMNLNSSASLVNFNNGSSFGTGPITLTTVSGPALIAESTGLVITNDIIDAHTAVAALNFSATGHPFSTTFSGNVALNSFNVNYGVGGGTDNTVTLSGVISGPGGFGRQSSTTHGVLKLTGANTYTGKTTLQSSVTSVSSINSVSTPAQQPTSNLGVPSSAANGTLSFGATTFTGTLLYTGAGETTDRVVDLAGQSGGAILDQSGTGLLKFTSATTATGIGTKSLTLQGATAGTGEFAGIISDNGTSGSTVTTAAAVTTATSLTLGSVDGIVVGAAVSGTGIAAGTTVLGVTNSTLKITLSAATTAAITAGATITIPNLKNRTYVVKSGSGTWTLSGVNTYTGNTTLNTAGRLNLANASAMGTGTNIIGGNGFFDNTSGSDMTVANALTLSGGSPTYVGNANNMTIGGPVTLSAANRTITVSAKTLTLNGAIGQDASARNFTKAGAGTLVVAATSTYTGTTPINAGTLTVTGNISSSSSVSINSTGTLNGTGTTPAVTVATNGTIAPGINVGTINTGNQTWNAAGHYAWQINDALGTAGSDPGWDTVAINGTLTIAATSAGKFNIDVQSLSGTAPGNAASFNSGSTWAIATTTGGITGFDPTAFNVTTNNLSNSTGGRVFVLSTSQDGKSLLLNLLFPAPSQSVTGAGTGTFTGAPNTSYTVQYTDTLTPINWQTLVVVSTDANGAGSYSDPGPLPTERYYRITQ